MEIILVHAYTIWSISRTCGRVGGVVCGRADWVGLQLWRRRSTNGNLRLFKCILVCFIYCLKTANAKKPVSTDMMSAGNLQRWSSVNWASTLPNNTCITFYMHKFSLSFGGVSYAANVRVGHGCSKVISGRAPVVMCYQMPSYIVPTEMNEFNCVMSHVGRVANQTHIISC